MVGTNSGEEVRIGGLKLECVALRKLKNARQKRGGSYERYKYKMKEPGSLTLTWKMFMCLILGALFLYRYVKP